MAKPPRVKIETVQELLRTAGRAFPIITIHKERIAPEVCHIGYVQRVTDDHVSLLEIGPDASWDSQAIDHRIRQITRVDFAGGYEDALLLVGGLPPNAEEY
jgi:hypothetical protein